MCATSRSREGLRALRRPTAVDAQVGLYAGAACPRERTVPHGDMEPLQVRERALTVTTSSASLTLANTAGAGDLAAVTSLQQRPAPTSQDRPGPSARLLGFVTGLAGLSALPFAAGVLLPYYVNGLHRLPLAEVASGRHDPKNLWPSGLGGGLLQLMGLLGLVVSPVGLGFTGVVAVIGAVWTVLARPSRPSRPMIAVGFALLAVVCLAALVWFAGPTAGALVTWRLD